ncbi:MAG TPA: thioredoxin domain-containing protein [Candidatus Binatia bacterium]|nr:thioredoxin domain-containing protein [Candidatus Binatia bacterium]
MGRRGAAVALGLWLAACSRGQALPAVETLPGAAPFDPPLARALATALAARGPGYRPRTRHLRPDGSPRWTNRLILESSPYLIEHAHNPVDWYPWGDEAFARAVAEGKPVLLSVGYATCHWCHVMEEESFEDEAIATYLNEHYVSIKVDREVRPDVDDAYMRAVELLTGGGGWPMTVWLTPGREPFYGGTYFPPKRFRVLLERLRAAFDAEPAAVAAQASAVAARVRGIAEPPAPGLPEAGLLRRAVDAFAADFDAVHGGFGGAPKFPSPPELDLLLRYHRHTGAPHALEMATVTLEHMAAGGIHDQLGGGFHRYATDDAWLLPHFEKTLPDNAQLAMVYLAAAQATGRTDLAAVARDALDWIARDLAAPDGGFYGATDADSAGGEGAYYLWTPSEIRAALPDPVQATAAVTWYAVTEAGDFHGRNVLHTPEPLPAVAARLGLDPPRLLGLLGAARTRLLAARRARAAPAVDAKVLAGWNGLAIAAFARAGAAFGEPAYVDRARAAARFVLDRMRRGDRLARVWAAGAPRGDAFLDDYAYVIGGLLDLYEATFDLHWLRAALALERVLERDFMDPARGAFFQTAAEHETPLARLEAGVDGALPSGNAAAALDLLRLAELTGDDTLRARADAVLRAFAPVARRAPMAAPALLAALDFRLDRVKEIVIVRPAGARGDDSLLGVVRAVYLPNRALAVAVEGDDRARQAALIPLVADKQALRGAATAYVCEARVCALPTSDPATLRAELARVSPLPP